LSTAAQYTRRAESWPKRMYGDSRLLLSGLSALPRPFSKYAMPVLLHPTLSTRAEHGLKASVHRGKGIRISRHSYRIKCSRAVCAAASSVPCHGSSMGVAQSMTVPSRRVYRNQSKGSGINCTKHEDDISPSICASRAARYMTRTTHRHCRQLKLIHRAGHAPEQVIGSP
jgi:hypothetical protein